MPSRSHRTVWHTLLSTTLILVLFPGCSDSPSGPGETPATKVTVESSNRATAVIGPAGGSVTTTSNAGIAYTLEVPPGALPADTEIAITPVSSISGLPYAGGIEGAVRLGPSGLRFLAPALLRIGTTANPTGTLRLVGFSYDGDAETFELAPAGEAGAEIRVLVSHFSGAGAALADPGDLPGNTDCGNLGPGEPLSIVLTTCVEAGDRAAFLDLMQRWFDDLVAPAIQNGTGNALQDAVRGYLEWRTLVEGGLAEVYNAGDAETVFANRILTAEVTVSERLEAGIADAKAQCASTSDVQWLIEVFEFRALAFAVFEGLPAGLDDATTLDGICATAVIESAELADPLPLNQDRSLDLDFGLDLNGTVTDAAFHVTVTDPDNVVGAPEGRTDAQGRYTTVVRRIIPEGASFHVTGTLILPIFGAQGLGLTQVPIVVEDEVFRGGNARITVDFPPTVVAGVATPMTVRAERLTSSGYEPIGFAVVSFGVDGGVASPDEVIATADGVATTSVTADGGARNVVVDVDVSLDSISLGTKQVQATVASGGIVFVSRSSDTYAYSSSDGGVGCSISHQPPDYDIYTGPERVALSEQAERTCELNGGVTETTSEFVFSLSDPGLAADNLSAELVFETSGTLYASSTGDPVATAEAYGSFLFDFDIVDTAMQFEASVELDPSGWGTGSVLLRNRDTNQYAFSWYWTQGNEVLAVGYLPPGRYQASFWSGGRLNSIDAPSASWFLNASIKITPVPAVIRAPTGSR